jgi:hypothetical protein
MKFEIDRLTEENKELRQLIERLLDSVECKSKNAMHDKLKDLTVQLNVILGVSEGEIATALGQVGEDLAKASQSNNADGSSDEPSDSSVGESSSLQDIETRMQRLSGRLVE